MKCSLLACALFLAGTLTTAQTADRFFALEFNSGRLVTFDLDGTNGKTVGFAGISNLSALVLAPDGFLYTFNATAGNVYRIDPSNAVAEFVGTLGFSVFEGGLTIAPNGIVYGVNQGSSSDSSLFVLDLSTGIGTLIGSMGAVDVNGIAWRSDGMLVGIERTSNALVEIDPATGVLTQVASLPTVVGGVGGMTIQEGKGWFTTSGSGGSISGSHEFWSFDPFTGDASFVRDLPEIVDGEGVAGLTGGSLLTSPGVVVSPGPQSTRDLRFVAPQSPGSLYFVLGSKSGTYPGFPLAGRSIPLVPDNYLFQTLFDPAATPLGASYGFLDASGTARISFSLPSTFAGSLGETWYHSVLTLEPGGVIGHVSNATSLRLSTTSQTPTGPGTKR